MAKILVVDDERDIRDMISVALEEQGHEVSTAPDGGKALRAMKRKSFDLVVLDIMMPELDGYGVLEQIDGLPAARRAPVIVVTARHDPTGVQREIAAGAVDHVAKPFLPSELEQAVERALSPGDHPMQDRRRILGSDADIYSSVRELTDLARAAQ